MLLFTSREFESEVKTMEEAYEQQQEQINWMIITNQINENEVQEEYQPELIRLEESILQKQNSIRELRGNTLEIGAGPCAASLDQILQELGVERQVYHGKSFIGNHCHKMLQVTNWQLIVGIGFGNLKLEFEAQELIKIECVYIYIYIYVSDNYLDRVLLFTVLY